MYTSIGQALKALSYGTFVNESGEYCRVSRYYIKNTLRFQIIFNENNSVTATRPAINTVSESKVLKVLNSENFKNICA